MVMEAAVRAMEVKGRVKARVGADLVVAGMGGWVAKTDEATEEVEELVVVRA